MTVRLANGKTSEFGRQIHDHRDALAKSVASKLLSDKTFQCLLRTPEDPEDEEEMKELFITAYQHAAKMSAYLLTQHETLVVQDPKGILPSFHHQMLDAVNLDAFHSLAKGSTRLDGHPVLAVTMPAVFKRGTLIGSLNDDRVLVSKADVIVEDKSDSDEAEKTGESENEAISKKN